MNLFHKVVGFFVGWWICPHCHRMILGLLPHKLREHVEAHGLSEIGALAAVDLILNLGTFPMYPDYAQNEVFNFFRMERPQSGGLPTKF